MRCIRRWIWPAKWRGVAWSWSSATARIRPAPVGTRAAVIAHAQELHVPIHIIGLSGGDDYDSPTLEVLARATGGELLESPDPAQLADLYQLLAFQVAGGYRLTFTGSGQPGTHTIRILMKVGDAVFDGNATYTVK